MSNKRKSPRDPPTNHNKIPPKAASDAVPVSNLALAVVGVGGSAGALAPLLEFFAAMPADNGLAFVVVTHQAPSSHSLLPEILAKSTTMPVCEVADQSKVEPNHVYVIPRGDHVTICAGVLSVAQTPDRERPPLPIDFFFDALARDQQRRAVGVVLSGTGKDGTLGLAAIRAGAGLALVQEPKTAEFDGMPTSAIAAQAADLVLPIAEMPARLLSYVRGLTGPGRIGTAPEAGSPEMDRIVTLIRVRSGHDFSAYKRDTLLRRIERRMELHHIEGLRDYARYLDANSDEVDFLWRDWLIGVSGFFRDLEAFHALVQVGLPELLAAREDGAPLRIWVPACATGEEAYSLAIVLLETLEQLGNHRPLQIFATDLDSVAIQTGRLGRYPESIATDVGEKRLERFFLKEGRSYRTKKQLRDLVVFAVQDLLEDPPFTRVDLISCRNFLIYVTPSAQQNLLRTFHYSLNPGGLLLLGSSESLTGCEGFFSTLDRRWKLFRREQSSAAKPPLHWTSQPVPPSRTRIAAPVAQAAKVDLADPLRKALAERFGPPAVIVDQRGQIEQVHGSVGAYLELPSGRLNANVVEMAREGLRAPLAAALRAVLKGDVALVKRTVLTKSKGNRLALNLTLERIDEPRLERTLLLISFQPIAERAAPPGRKSKGSARDPASDVVEQIEQELQHTRQDLQSHIDELQASNEELASANEEVQSVNEELQSTNEELQTAKEETQSLNEELHTVNAELTQKLQSFAQANDDILNLMNSIEIATIFLDGRLRVKRFTPQARRVARLIDSDVGRPLADLAILLDYPELLSDAESVLQSLRPVDKQALAPDASWYAVRIRPYRTANNAIEGLVVTFIDITETKRAERVQAARILAEGVVDAVREPLLVLDDGLRVVRANRSFFRMFGVEPGEIDGRVLQDLGSRQWDIVKLRELLARTLHDGVGFEDFEVEHEFPHIGRRQFLLNARPVAIKDGETAELIVLGIQEVIPKESAESGATKEPAV